MLSARGAEVGTSGPNGASTRVPDVSTARAPLGPDGAPDEPGAATDDGPESDDDVVDDPIAVDSVDAENPEHESHEGEDLGADETEGATLVITEDDLGDELDAELEAEAAELAPLVELPDRHQAAAEPEPPAAGPTATEPAVRTAFGRPRRNRDEVEVRVRGRGKVPARKARRVLRRVDPLSVLKLSLAFNLCVLGMFLVAAVLLWSAAIGSGSSDKIESFIVDIGFEDFQLVGADLFRGFVVFGGGLVIAFTVIAVLLALLFNLISDVLGGIRYTVIEPTEPADSVSQGAAGE